MKSLVGNCRFLAGSGIREQPEIDKLRAAIKKGEAIERSTLRNYRKNGELFYNRFRRKTTAR
jgi:hypothetical protein